jgi:hypothetical protein
MSSVLGIATHTGRALNQPMLENDIAVYGALFALLGLVFVFHRTFSNYFSKRGHRE